MRLLFWFVVILVPFSMSHANPGKFRDAFTSILQEENLPPVFLFDDQSVSQITENQDFEAYKKEWDTHQWQLAQAPLSSRNPPHFSSDRITFLVFPGILGEFIPKKPFDDVAEQYRWVQSPLVEAWASLDPKAFLCPHTNLALSGETYQLAEDHSPLRELFTIFALPETRNSPGADVVILKAPLFSLETLGDMTHLGQRYVQRVARLWSALAFRPKHLVLVGYSLGVIPAFDFVYASQGLKDFVHPEALISLSGLIFGSTIADEALGYGRHASSLYRELVENLWNLRQNLRPIEGNESLKERLVLIHLNQMAWMRFLVNLSDISIRHTEDLMPLKTFASSLLMASDQQKVLQGLSFFGALLTENGQLLRAYNRNIRRWQLFLEQARTAVDQLSTRGRQRWFQERGPLPSSLKLISVSAMMPNEILLDQSRSQVVEAFDPDMLDFQFIRQNLRMNQKLTEIDHLDGWVGLGESRYDPHISCQWAPAWCSARFVHEWWGVLNTDHWGLAIAKALPQKEELIHPFPRDIFLKAAAQALSSDDGP